MLEFLSQQYFGNNLLQYSLFFGTLIISLIVGKILSFIIKNYAQKLADKTKSKIDDMLLDIIEKPILVILVLLGAGVGFQFLNSPNSFADFFYNSLSIVGVIIFAWFLIRLVDAFIEEVVKPGFDKTESKLDDQLLPIISRGVKASIIIIAFVVILSSFGYDVTALVAGLGIGGLAFAFAAKETISDAFGGLSIFTSKPFVVGDWVQIDKVVGVVEEVGLRFTRIRNLDKRLVTIPNSKVAKGIIENISSAPKRKIVLNLGLTYGTSSAKLEKAKKMLSDIINKHPECEDNPHISFSEFKDSSLNLFVIYYILPGEKSWLEVRGEINDEIKKQFDKAKLDFAFPSQSIYLEK